MMKDKKLIYGILVIAILAIAGIGLLVLNRHPTQEITITTDRLEYKQGEPIGITVRNGLDVTILYYASDPFWGIEYLEDGKWNNSVYERGGFQLTEENINDTCYIKLYERWPPIKMKANSVLSQQWNQKICPLGEEGPSEPRFVKYIGAGHYRLIFHYSFGISSEDPYIIKDEKTVYSNEFTIKEKEFSRSECEKAPDGTSCTVGLWYDEFGRACGGQSCVGLGLGKCFQGKCMEKVEEKETETAQGQCWNYDPQLSEESILEIKLTIDKKDNITLGYLDYIEVSTGRPPLFQPEGGEYSLKVLDKTENILYERKFQPGFFLLSDPPKPIDTSSIFDKIKYSSLMYKVEVFRKDRLLFFHKIGNVCDCDYRCESNETYFSCPVDCESWAEDGICSGEYDGVCDPDCISGDVDCEIQKENNKE